MAEEFVYIQVPFSFRDDQSGRWFPAGRHSVAVADAERLIAAGQAKSYAAPASKLAKQDRASSGASSGASSASGTATLGGEVTKAAQPAAPQIPPGIYQGKAPEPEAPAPPIASPETAALQAAVPVAVPAVAVPEKPDQVPPKAKEK